MNDAKEISGKRYQVPAVEQASRILFCLANTGSSHMSLIEICDEVGIHKSKAFSILQTLYGFGLVQRNNDGKGYSLGPGLISLSRKFLDNLNAPTLAAPILEELSKQTTSTAVLGLIAGGHVFVAAKHEGDNNIGITMRIGRHLPLTYGSHGKAIFAFLPQKEREHLLMDNDLYFHGNPEKLDRFRLQKELTQCRRDWYALDLGEVKMGLNAIAAPVLGPGGVPVGYIVVLGLFSAKTARSYGSFVAEAGKRLSHLLGADIDEVMKEPSDRKEP